MTVQATEFTALGGLVNAEAFWPDLSATKRTQMFASWVLEGEIKTADFAEDTQDAGTRAWVKVRWTEDVFQRMYGNPASNAADGEGSSGYTQGQIQMAADRAAAALAEWEALEDAEVEEETVTRLPLIGSRSTDILFRF